ncbi:MAG: metallo-mystery pair system four-Cys motif protein [Sandaracinaceae bacterium]
MRTSSMRPWFLAAPVAVLAACGPTTPASTSVELMFEARVGTQPFECGRTYEGIGSTGTALTVSDLRFYVHDVRLVTSAGREVPVTLDDDDFQNGGIALLDFETGGSGCEAGNAPTHTELTGTVAEAGPFTALRFRIGVPEARNHLDSGSQPSPLNLTSMYWNWQGGYKFLRFEGRTTGLSEGLVFHLGATACSGDAMAGTRTCANGNRPDLEIALPAGFSPSTHRFVVDVARWLAAIDLDTDMGGEPGCMSGPMDPECPAWLASVGLPSGSTQTLVTVEAR